MSKRLIGYARVSKNDQSIDSQVDALKAHGCSIVFSDEGISGVTTSRPELDRCLRGLEIGDVLVVVRLDRLGRSAAHLTTTVEALAEGGVGFRSLNEAIDTTSAAGRLILGIFGALAGFERDLIAERTSAALRAKQRRGERLGRPLALRPSQVEVAAKLIADGESHSHIARLFRVDRATLYRALKRRIPTVP